ncbi:DnaJ-domain-containing protein, partial [Coemansia reversa NRRL 1564]
CYYDLLGVERNANDSELKKAYRKQALVWHPDKNHGNAEEATQVFAEIREAYETLSDPNERAWYDDHREQILRGDEYAATASASGGYAQNNPNASVSFTPTSVLMRYFSVSSFSGFDDSAKGFFAVYRSLFDTLRDEELQVVDAESEDRLDLIRNLSFGDAHTLYDEDEIDFYNFWTTFTTRKSFGWFDRYRLADADNRQIRRLMEKENRHLRDKAKREFVDAVQNLAAWLKRRDPRYKRYVEEKRQQQQQQEFNRKRRVLEQRAAAVDGAGSYVCQAWEEVDYTSVLDDLLGEDPETNYTEGAAVDGREQPSHSDSSADEDELFCAVCEKEFKSAAQKVNHEQSKKHQKAVRAFRREIQREEQLLAKTQ